MDQNVREKKNRKKSNRNSSNITWNCMCFHDGLIDEKKTRVLESSSTIELMLLMKFSRDTSW